MQNILMKMKITLAKKSVCAYILEVWNKY